MKIQVTVLLAISVAIHGCFSQDNRSIKRDDSSSVNISSQIKTIGFFDGIFINKTGYKINDYFIAWNEITSRQVDSFAGRQVMVTGTLKRVRDDGKNIQGFGGERKYIVQPVITIISTKD